MYVLIVSCSAVQKVTQLSRVGHCPVVTTGQLRALCNAACACSMLRSNTRLAWLCRLPACTCTRVAFTHTTVSWRIGRCMDERIFEALCNV
jgi:hypothetical protein